MMSPEEIMAQASARERDPPRRRRRRWLIWGSILLIVVIIVVVAVVLTQNGDPEREQMMGQIKSALDKEGVPANDLNNAGHYQGKAFNWLYEQNANINSMDRTQALQRFALACLYFSSNGISTLYTPSPPSWKSETNWLTDLNECQWKGVQCTDRMKVDGIALESNHLTGKIPAELVLLRDHLVTLDFTTNLLYMEEADFYFLEKLPKLTTILMDDNYISSDNGIPSFMGHCTQLEMLRLSYNLIGGKLDATMFRKLSKLTHLEVESNFLTGGIPTAIGELSNLVYMYMRRNSLKFNLNWLKSGKMANLFAMWLDANSITGTLPTQLGLLTEMASLSLTNGTLAGTIPTELGNLSGLRRLWLYGNKLTGAIPTELGKLELLEVVELQQNDLQGTMPPRVCSFIGISQYAHKSLVADCEEVACTNCCTKCH